MAFCTLASRPLVLAACALAFSGAVLAQSPPASGRKPPPRLPPTAADQSRIPAGVDTGSPATSDTLPLGTPVLPANSAERDDLRIRSAAARAAARRTGGASAAATGASAADRLGCAPKITADGRAGGEPVALPGSGFTGQSASPSTRAQIAPRPVGRVC